METFVNLNVFTIFLHQISVTEHLKQLTDAHRDFGLLHGESNTLNTHLPAYIRLLTVDEIVKRLCVWERERDKVECVRQIEAPTSRRRLTQQHSISDVLAREGRVTQRRAVNGSLNNWICDETERAYKDHQSFSCSMSLWWCIDLFMQLVFLVLSLNSNMTSS